MNPDEIINSYQDKLGNSPSLEEIESEREKELVFVYKTVYDGEIAPSDELDGGRFWTVTDIKKHLGKGVFTPNFESELNRVNLIN